MFQKVLLRIIELNKINKKNANSMHIFKEKLIM